MLILITNYCAITIAQYLIACSSLSGNCPKFSFIFKFALKCDILNDSSCFWFWKAIWIKIIMKLFTYYNNEDRNLSKKNCLNCSPYMRASTVNSLRRPANKVLVCAMRQ